MSQATGLRKHLAALALGSILAGCVSMRDEPVMSRPGGEVFPPGRVVDTLAAAEDDEMGGLLTAPSPGTMPTPKERAWRLGVRAGALVTAASEQDWGPGVSFGAFYRGAPRRRIVYELGLDYASAESDEGSTSSGLLFLRGDVLFGRWDPEGNRARFYLAAGAQGIREEAELDGSGKTESRTGGGVNLGLGIGSAKGRWDVRAVYSIVLGSDNAKGDVMVATGFAF